MGKLEKEVQTEILQFLDSFGIPYSVTDASTNWRIHRRSMKRSWPDITAVLSPGGRCLCIEVKTEDGGYQPGQEDMLTRLKAAGALAITARSVEDVKMAIAGNLDRAMEAEAFRDWGMHLTIWNERIAPLWGAPKLRELTSVRLKSLKLRLKERPELWELIEAEGRKVNDFFKEKRFATFDWLIRKPDNLCKFLEGNYRKLEYQPGPKPIEYVCMCGAKLPGPGTPLCAECEAAKEREKRHVARTRTSSEATSIGSILNLGPAGESQGQAHAEAPRPGG